eukprot:SAG22_NODE_22131_length_251_cov_0.684211_1_plen_75_part_10
MLHQLPQNTGGTALKPSTNAKKSKAKPKATKGKKKTASAAVAATGNHDDATVGIKQKLDEARQISMQLNLADLSV